jgi:hypothetical protein
MKRYVFLFAMLLGLAAFMFAQASSQTAPPQQNPSYSQDRDAQTATPQAATPQTPDYSQQVPDRDAQDQDEHHAKDQDRDRDANKKDRDRDRTQVYDRDQTYQDQDRRDQKDNDNGVNRDQDRDRDRDANQDRDRDRDMDRDHDRNRVGVGGDAQSQIYSALRNDARFSDVNVSRNGDRIDLTGNVPTGRDRDEAVRIAQSYANGMRVDNHLKVTGRGHDRD